MARRIWTQAARQLLFEQLTERSGPLSEWEGTTRPGREKNQEYDDFCAQFATVVKANSGDAVKHQIRWGSPTIGEAEWGPGQVQTAILCLAAAFEAGFIKDSDLPTLRATSRKISN